ncbi:hypothetical protein BGZ75_004244, partial [Mortierella antarctica]
VWTKWVCPLRWTGDCRFPWSLNLCWRPCGSCETWLQTWWTLWRTKTTRRSVVTVQGKDAWTLRRRMPRRRWLWRRRRRPKVVLTTPRSPARMDVMKGPSWRRVLSRCYCSL